MSAEKKKTKEDTWRPDELMKYIQGPDGENRRRERTKRDETPRKQRSGESTDRRLRDPERDERREREEESRRRDERERRKEREGDRDRRGSERRGGGDERENRDREKERQRERYKDRDREREKDRETDNRLKERDRERDREKDNRLKERDRERDREKDNRLKERDRERDREKERYRDRDRDKERSERYKDREREGDRDKEKDRYKDRERDERHGEREKDRDGERERRRRAEKERRREIEEGKYREIDKEREREKREHRTEYSGHTDRDERRERRRREKEHYEAGERYHGDLRETERDRRHRDGENGRLRDGEEERVKRKEKRNEESKKSSSDHRRDKSDSKLRNSDQEISTKRPELSWRSNQAELSDPEIPMENEDNENNNKGDEDYENEEYEEDFERADYEEDFEEMGEEDEEKGGEKDEKGQDDGQTELSPRRREEIEAIQRAMQRENELVSSAHSQPSTSKAEPTQKVGAGSESRLKKGRTHGRVIDFAAARQREVSQQVAEKQKKRSAELLRLIDLDYSVTMCLLDLPPVSEYDMYIKSFGMANTKQAYVQCNEDNTDRDTQTEETDTVDKWTQHPPETNIACGGPKASQDASDDSMTRMNVDSKRLTTFLRSAAQVMAVLLEENRAESSSVKKLNSQTDSLSFSEGCLHLNTTQLPLLQGRQVTLLNFSQVQTHTLLSVHGPCSGLGDEQLNSKTLICVWNIWEPSTPQRILTYEAEVRCCCFSPGKATLVFAGTAVGSVVLWDLREHSGSHSSIRVDGEEWTLRYPTFSTDAVLSGAGHFSPLVSVEPVVVNVDPGIRGSLIDDQEESLGLLFQLGSLDENGLLNLWVVTELSKADDSGSQTDLGLRPGGKVKLLHSSSIQTSDRSAHHGVTGVTPPLSLLLKFLPSDSNHYFIGTNMGVVRRGTRHGLRAVPKLYRPEDGERPADVTSLDFCPSGEPFFLVGCSDGTFRLHSVLQEEPVLEWSTGSGDVPVLSVLWSRTRTSVFCVLDAASVLHVWDLTEKDTCPIISESFQTDRVTTMAVFGEAARHSRYSGMALAKQSGRLEIHFLKPSLTVPQPSDTERLHLLAQDNI